MGRVIRIRRAAALGRRALGPWTLRLRALRLWAIVAAWIAVGGAFGVERAWAAPWQSASLAPCLLAAAEEGDHGSPLDRDDPTHVGHANPGANLENPVEIRSDMAIATFLVFVVLLLILWKFAWGPISEGLEKREAGIAANIAGAEDANRAAKALLKEHEKKLADSAAEVREMLDEARRDAERTKAAIIAEAKVAAEAERTRGLREIEDATGHALKALAEKNANLAVELAGKIVESKLSPDEHARLIDDAMNRFPNMAASKN